MGGCSMTKEEFELLVQPGDYIRVQTARETVEGTVKALLSSSVLLLRRGGGRSVVEIDQVTRLELDLEQPQDAPMPQPKPKPEPKPEPQDETQSRPRPEDALLPNPEDCCNRAAQAVARGAFDQAEYLYTMALIRGRTAETVTKLFQTVYLSRAGTPEEQVARARRGLYLLEQQEDILPRAAYINFRVHLLDDAGETELYKQEME